MGPIQQSINQGISIASLLFTQSSKYAMMKEKRKTESDIQKLKSNKETLKKGEEELKGQFKRFFDESGELKSEEVFEKELSESNLSDVEKNALRKERKNVREGYENLVNEQGNINYKLVNEYGDVQTIKELSDLTKSRSATEAVNDAYKVYEKSLVNAQNQKRNTKKENSIGIDVLIDNDIKKENK